MSTWQPIETAPKDGTRVLVFHAHVHIAWWTAEAWFGDSLEARPGWQIFDCEEDHWYSWATDSVTHWMPLPEPPAP